MRWSQALRSPRQNDRTVSMIYSFRCGPCQMTRSVDSLPFHPPEEVICACGSSMRRLYECQIDTSGCRDHDGIPEQSRVQRYQAPQSVEREEHRFQQHIEQRRNELRGGNRGSFRHTHSVPADLYHGKIRQTGDKEYWKDPKNLKRHRNTKVDG